MNTQILVIDYVRRWHQLDDNAQYATKDLENCTLSLISRPVEFEGTEEFSVVVLWDEVPGPIKCELPGDVVQPTQRQAECNDIIKRFVTAVGCEIKQVNHDNRTTKVKLNPIEPKNVQGFDFLEDTQGESQPNACITSPIETSEEKA